MEFPAVAQPWSPLIPIQTYPKAFGPSTSATRLTAAPFRNRYSAVQAASPLASISSVTPNAPSALINSLHNHSGRGPPFHGKPSSTQKHISAPKAASSPRKSTTHLRIPFRNRDLLTKATPVDEIAGALVMHSLKNHLSTPSRSPLLKSSSKSQLQLSVMSVLSVALPSFASETERMSDKIDIESILISIDSFFNRYPFFVAGVTFVWLVVIPLAQEYLKKYKYISAINAFRKLREDPNSQLLDIRKQQSRAYLDSPNLKILNKNVVQVEFSEGQEGEFVKEVLKNFQDPSSTVVCILDNFDGDSLKVAELLFNNGFKEAYAIKGGVRGKDGWQAIQETLLPPSIHIYPGKKKSSREVNTSSERINKHYSSNSKSQISSKIPQGGDNGQIKAKGAASGTKFTSRSSLSPYPNYPDLKPPSSPSPSKPQ